MHRYFHRLLHYTLAVTWAGTLPPAVAVNHQPAVALPTPPTVALPGNNPSTTIAHGSYVDPTTGGRSTPHVLRAFDKPAHNWLPGHRGVDLEASVGNPILAAGDGVVAFAGLVAGRPSVSIDHPDGLRTTYTPVFDSVTVGESVRAGQVIGQLGAAADGYPGLHWGALQGPNDYLNPLSLLDMPVIRLKPLGT